MANVNNDDEIEIHNLPEVGTLQAGMMVAVDSQPTGTKSFNLSTALEGKANASDVTDLATAVAGKAEASDVNTALEGKVDSPATAPTTGQVLMFDGTDNVWSNPPEGVYILNYSEVSDLNDIDINRVKTQPTFMKVDTDITVTIPTSDTPYTVSVQQGTLMAIDEIGPEGTSGSYTGPKFISFYANNGKNVGGGIMQNADLKLLCMVSLRPFGGVAKAWGANGFLNNDGALLGGTMPAPVTFKCTNSRGPGEDTDTTNHALKVEIQSFGRIRTQSLLPAEIETHDFATDETPEDIQFMGWGVISNRAGYRTINEVPASNAALSDYVLKVTADGSYGWGNAVGFVKNVGELTDAPTITSTTINNGFATLSTSQSALTIVDRVDLYEVVNFALEISPSVNCTLTIQKQIGYQTPVTLKHSVAGGNTLEAGKTYQVTAVGTCWTLAEFEA